ncbi:MAG: UDP-N-acetylmuramoyl-L-alanine--D-glutamate ligase [Betaproteobacteria bacterium]
MKSLQDKHVLVLGLGLSGLALARWCLRCGAQVTVADTRQAPPQWPALQAHAPEVRFISGPFGAELVQGQQAVFKSPGLSPAEVAPVVDAARAIGLHVGNELTLFAQALAELAVPPQWPEPSASLELTVLPSDELLLPTRSAELEPQQFEAAQPMSHSEPGEAMELPADDEADAVHSSAALDEAASADAAPAAPEPPPPGYRPKVLAITGTNGKTTVTSLTGLLVERAGRSVAVAGNIGPTLLDTLTAALDADRLPEVWVLELSSFQLDEVSDFEPSAATVLNLTQDHLDWHGSMPAYAKAKSNIYGRKALMLLTRDDPMVMAQLPVPAPVKGKAKAARVRAHQTFGTDLPTRPGDWGLEEVGGMSWLVRAAEADETIKRGKVDDEPIYIQRLMPAEALHIRGRHNASNALAALALATAAGCSLAPMLHGLRQYRGEPHRVEPVGVIAGVEFFDDSKGTNVGATAAALKGLGAERKVVPILGGQGKGQDFAPLAAPLARYSRAAVLIGRDAPALRLALAQTGVPLHDAPDMAAAVRAAFGLAQSGDAVLLSPACASFDMFRDYEHRAKVFCEAVQDLAHEQGVML